MILVHNESFTSPQHRQLIFVSLQLLYLAGPMASRVRDLLFSSDYCLQIFQIEVRGQIFTYDTQHSV
jgi:hypothetical protein